MCGPPPTNSYPVYDQNLRFSIPYLSPDQKFDTLFTTVSAGTVAQSIIHEGLLMMVLSIMMKTKLLKNLRIECKNHTLFMAKIAKVDTLFMIKTAEKPYPLGPHIFLYSQYKRVPPGAATLPIDNPLRVASCPLPDFLGGWAAVHRLP